MNRGKFPKNRSGLEKSFRALLPLLLIVIVIALSAGGTLAYILDRTNAVTNSFTPARVSCSVVESNGTYTIQNTGNIPAYIRATVIVNHLSEDGDLLYNGTNPVFTVNDEEWANGQVYYHGAAVPVNGTFTLTVASQESNLKIQVLAEAIQADGMGATSAQDAWAKAKTTP